MPTTMNIARADLADIAGGTSPFISVYVGMEPASRDTLVTRVAAIADGLRALGADPDQVARATTPFLSPPEDRAAMAVIVSHDGRVLVASSPDPIQRDLGELAVVPRLGPIIEWGQQMITHAVIRPSGQGRLDVTVFDDEGSVTPYQADQNHPESVVGVITAHRPAAVFLTGEDCAPVRDALLQAVLHQELPSDCHVEALDATDDDTLADVVVRHTASVVASRKVELLQEFRFERSHEGAVEGIDAVTAAANDGRISTLLIHTDPDDGRRVSLGPDGALGDILDPAAASPTGGAEARLVDAIISRTLRSGGAPVVVPHTTGERGPDDDLGAFLRPRPPEGLIG